MRPVPGGRLPSPLRCSALCDVMSGRDWMGWPVEASGKRDCGNLKEVAGSAGEAAVGGERDQGGGEVGKGLDREADRQRGGDTAAAVNGGEGSGCEHPV